MAVNPLLLVQDDSLQEYLVDKDTGLPLANGIITFYQDTSRLTLKPVYKQTGSPGSYTYVALSNPLILSSVGTTVDEFGNDIKIFYYPYDESDPDTNDPAVQTYYITVVSEDLEPQFVRENFPFIPGGGAVDTNVPGFENLIVNNRFWRNGGTINNPANGTTLAPSQHDTFRYPDIVYLKDGTGETEVLTFSEFPAGVVSLTEDVQPEFYLNHNNTVAGSSTFKYISIPISLHLLTLGGYPNGNITIQARGNSGENTLSMYVLADTGTGAAVATPALIGQFTLNTSWTKYQTGTFTFPPSLAPGSISKGGDDAFYLLIGLPVGVTNIDIALPSVYLSDQVPTNDFATYDQTDSVISSPRTGDVRSSLNAFSPFGWVAANNGSIGSGNSSATTRANIDTWALYNLLWTNVNDTFAPVAGGRGASAIADFGTANKVMLLPLMLGRVLMGLPLTQTATYNHLTQLFTVADATLYYFGTPVTLTTTGTLPDAFTANTVYYAIPINGVTTFQLASTYANAIARVVVAAGTTDGTGTLTVNPSLGGSFGEGYHTQLAGEVGIHTHPSASGNFITSTTPGTLGLTNGTDVYVTTPNTGVNAGGEGMNIVQPSVYMNVFLKL